MTGMGGVLNWTPIVNDFPLVGHLVGYKDSASHVSYADHWSRPHLLKLRIVG